VFEAWVDRREGRCTFSVGRLTQNGVVTVEAEGEFAALPHGRTESLAQRQTARSPAAAETRRRRRE
jgi:hypothetical protein